jgi:ZIP family zinc transporter
MQIKLKKLKFINKTRLKNQMVIANYIFVILLAFLSSSTSLLGVLLALWIKKKINLVVVGIGFSAGIMLSISFFELVPESMLGSGKSAAILSFVLGFVFLLAMHFLIPHYHIFKNKTNRSSRVLKTGLLVAFGLMLHDIPEGFTMSNTFLYAPNIGIIVILATALHNIPEQFAVSAPLALLKGRKWLLKMAMLSTLAEPLGALLGVIFASLFSSMMLAAMAFTAGAMIFISIDELYPLAKEYNKPHMFLIGIALSLVVYFGLSSLL